MLCTLASQAQQVTLDQCLQMAKDNYPQVRKKGLIDKAEQYDLRNASIAWAPQLTVSGKATYQSDVMEMPFEIPGYSFDLPHDQYSVVGELSQQLWDGGETVSKKRIVRAGSEVERKQLEVTLYALNERVQNIYLGILLIDKQAEQNSLLMQSLQRSMKEVEAMIDNGMAYRSDKDIVMVNILNCEQQAAELEADRKAYTDMLGRLTGTDMSAAQFAEPSDDLSSLSGTVSRPELALYDAQLLQSKAQRKELDSRISPKFSLSLQAGAGRPGLNMLKNEFDPYYTAGLKMQWNIGALYTRRNDIRKIETQQSSIEADRETFLFNTSLDMTDGMNAIAKMKMTLERDNRIIELRESVRKAGEEQYRSGVIKMTDLLDLIDDEHDARLARSVHQVQLLMEIYKLRNITGEYTTR